MPKDPLAKELPVEAEWWRAKELGKRPDEILDTLVRQIEDDQASRYTAYKEYARLFGADPDMFGYEDDFSALASEEVSQNELANTIETLHAQVFKNRVVPTVSVSEADWEETQRGKAYSRWLEGMFDRSEAFYDAVPRFGLDALVYGTGFIKIGHVEEEGGQCRLTHTRVDTRMVAVDRLEARGGKPRSLFQKDFVDKFLLADIYSKQERGFYGTPEERIQHILHKVQSNNDQDMALGSRSKCDMVVVREAWHLPSRAGAKNGRHVIWITGCTLLDEEWDWDRFPFTVIRFGNRLSGFYGDSAVKRLAPTQKNYDKLNKKIDQAQDLMGVCRMILSRGANIQRAHIDDIPGGILETDGDINNSIKEWNATAVAPELYQERGDAPRKMRSLLGVSDFEVQNQLPQSMREISGPAMERWVDSGTARHALFHGELERAMMDLAYLSMRYAEELQDRGKRLTVTAPGYSKSTVENLEFGEVRIDRDRLKLRVQPMSQMPQTMSGKIDAFDKMRERGDLTKAQYLKLVELPDTAGTTDFLGADEDIILKNLHFMVKKGKYIPPLQYDNLDLIVPLTTSFINWYRIKDDADMEKVGMLAQYIEDAIALKQGLGGPDANAPPPPQDPMAAQMGAPPMDPSMGPPPGMPMDPSMGPPPGMVPPPPGPMAPPGPPVGPGMPAF